MSIFDSTDDTHITFELIDQVDEVDRTPINIASFVVWTNICLSVLASVIIYIKLIKAEGSPFYWVVIFAVLLQCLLSWALFKMFAAITINIIVIRKQFTEYLERTKL